MRLKINMRNGVICLAISKVSLTLPKLTDPPNIETINTALKGVEDKINLVIDDVNKSLKEISTGDGYIEVDK